jgi:aminoglycoside 3-N-acetyltransferase I
VLHAGYIMATSPAFTLRILRPSDVDLLRSLMRVFGEAFADPETYTADVPSVPYHERLLASDTFVAIVALKGEVVVGGLAAYELHKFERQRKEIYIYDLAVDAAHRREGIATAMIRELQSLAQRRGAYVIFVQADYVDAPAVALYSKLGIREDVLHFDLPPQP